MVENERVRQFLPEASVRHDVFTAPSLGILWVFVAKPKKDLSHAQIMRDLSRLFQIASSLPTKQLAGVGRCNKRRAIANRTVVPATTQCVGDLARIGFVISRAPREDGTCQRRQWSGANREANDKIGLSQLSAPSSGVGTVPFKPMLCNLPEAEQPDSIGQTVNDLLISFDKSKTVYHPMPSSRPVIHWEDPSAVRFWAAYAEPAKGACVANRNPARIPLPETVAFVGR